MFIRKVKNKSGNIGIQIVKKINRKNRIVKHIGTGKTILEIEELIKEAEDYLTSERIKSGKLSLFDNRLNKKEIDRILDRFEFVKAYYTVTYKLLEYFYQKIGLNKIKDDCFKDLVLIRIVDPASKRQSRELLEIKFNKKYSLTSIYRGLKKSFALNYQDRIEKIVYEFVKNTTDKIISVLFFDVTTLYYESFDEDAFRKYGFSKDNKHNQPQIIVALTIANSGMSKSDLKARPIFHTVKESITAHLTIVFTALAVSRYIELKSNLSIAKVINSLNQIKEIIVKDKISEETTSKFTNSSAQVKEILSLTKLTWVT